MTPAQTQSSSHSWLRSAVALLKTAVPLIIAQLAQQGIIFIDTLMAGRLGETALASIGLGGAVFGYALLIFAGVIVAVGPLVSQSQGASKPVEAGNAARHGLFLALLIGVPMTLFFWNAEPLLRLLRQPETTIELTASYLRIVAFGFTPYLCYVALRGLMEGSLHTRPVMLFSFIAVAVKLFLNYLLMFGNFGFPELGLVGAAYATLVVEFLLLTLGLWYVGRYLWETRVFSPNFDGKTLREVLRVGVPIGLSLAFEGGMFTVVTLLMGTLGAVQLAAHQIASQSAYFTFTAPLGIANATAVRVGQAVGKGNVREVKQMGRLGVGFAALAMVSSALVYWLAPQFVIGLYINLNDAANANVIPLATAFLGIAAMFQVFDGTQVAAMAALRGLKDTRIPMLISLLSYWFVGMGGGVLMAFPLGLGGRGLWFGLMLGLAVAATLLTLRFNVTMLRRLERTVT
jgi:multidrug resistance protein, MATE family